MKIRAKVSDWHGDMEFEVITIIDSTKIVTQKSRIFSEIFSNDTRMEKSEKYERIDVKRELKNGRINENYKDSLLTKETNVPSHVTLTVDKLPEGLRYNPNDCSIEGMPKKEGVYCIEVSNPVDNSITKVNVEIIRSLFCQKTTNEAEKSGEKKKRGSKPKIKLGKAFQ